MTSSFRLKPSSRYRDLKLIKRTCIYLHCIIIMIFCANIVLTKINMCMRETLKIPAKVMFIADFEKNDKNIPEMMHICSV